jgi:hypothetical protein
MVPLIFTSSTKSRRVVRVTHPPLDPPERTNVPMEGPTAGVDVLENRKSLAPTAIRTPDRAVAMPPTLLRLPMHKGVEENVVACCYKICPGKKRKADRSLQGQLPTEATTGT